MMFTQLAVLLGTALLLGALARRMGFPALVGELCAGVILGPSLLGWIAPGVWHNLFPDDGAPTPGVIAIGQLGVVFLVGTAAAELGGSQMRANARVIGTVSAASYFLPLAMGIGLGLLIPTRFLHDASSSRTQFALLMGTALAVSAIPVIAVVLTQLGLLRTRIGQLILSSAALTDVGAWILLAVESAMGTVGLRGWQVPRTILMVLGAVLVAIAIAPLVRRVLAKLESPERQGYFIAVAALLILLGGAATDAAHMEAALGAFLAGCVVGRRAEWVLAPLHTVTAAVLAPIFLATAGLHLDFTLLGDPTLLLVVAAVLAVGIGAKLISGYAGARLAGMARWDALAIGAGLNARGVVEIIIASVGHELGIFDDEIYMVVVVLALVTSIIAGPMLAFAVRRSESAGTAAESATERRDDDDRDGSGTAADRESGGVLRPQAENR